MAQLTWSKFKYAFSKTRRLSFGEQWQCADGVLSCPWCNNLSIIISDAIGESGKCHCSKCKFTASMILFQEGGIDRSLLVNGKRLDIECPECGAASNMIVRQNRKSGNFFLGCSRYPTCDLTMQVSNDLS